MLYWVVVFYLELKSMRVERVTRTTLHLHTIGDELCDVEIVQLLEFVHWNISNFPYIQISHHRFITNRMEYSHRMDFYPFCVCSPIVESNVSWLRSSCFLSINHHSTIWKPPNHMKNSAFFALDAIYWHKNHFKEMETGPSGRKDTQTDT